MAHYWNPEDAEKYNMRIPIWENYLLYRLSYLHPARYRQIELVDHRKAIERGVGLCAQQAMIMTSLLQENGVEANLVLLGGHVVLRAKLKDGEWYIADPDFGVVIPHDLPEIERSILLARPFYEEVVHNRLGGAGNPYEVYDAKGNVILRDGTFVGYHGRKTYIEQVSYVAIWVIPFLLFLPSLASLMKRRFGVCFRPLPALRRRSASEERSSPSP